LRVSAWSPLGARSGRHASAPRQTAKTVDPSGYLRENYLDAPPLTYAWAIHRALHRGREALTRLHWRVRTHLHTAEPLQCTLPMSLVMRLLDHGPRRYNATAPRRHGAFQSILGVPRHGATREPPHRFPYSCQKKWRRPARQRPDAASARARAWHKILPRSLDDA